jgi:hypothetical protein
MSVRRLRLAIVPALIAALAGCGHGGGGRDVSLKQLPLVPGATIISAVKQCDRGANSFCAVNLVIVDRLYHSSTQLLKAEHVWVHAAGWRGVGGDTDDEKAAESPTHNLRVTYATAFGDLKDIDLELIRRPRQVSLALSHAMFNRSSALSILLEAGSSS